MANTQVQLRRGTTAENDAFTGAEGEVVYDTEKKQLRVHDGEKVGGFSIDPLVAFQTPTAENGYTWYRLYASGWVEQGGAVSVLTGGQYAIQTVALPVEMQNTLYTITAIAFYSGGGDTSVTVKVDDSLTTVNSFGVRKNWSSTSGGFHWQVSGIAKVGE